MLSNRPLKSSVHYCARRSGENNCRMLVPQNSTKRKHTFTSPSASVVRSTKDNQSPCQLGEAAMDKYQINFENLLPSPTLGTDFAKSVQTNTRTEGAAKSINKSIAFRVPIGSLLVIIAQPTTEPPRSQLRSKSM